MLRVEKLSKTFGPTKALDDVSLHVKEGEMVALIGASGSGKSTMLRHVSGLLAADQGRAGGEVTVAGRPIQSGGRLAPDIRRERASIAIIFQQFNLVGRLTVLTNVLLGALGRLPLWRAMSSKFPSSDRNLALEALAKVGIEETAHRRASTLSGGQHVIQAAVAYVVGPAIASQHPDGALDEVIRQGEKQPGRGLGIVLEGGLKLVNVFSLGVYGRVVGLLIGQDRVEDT